MNSEPTENATHYALASALEGYDAGVSANYDEVVHEVSERIRSVGSVGKADIGALLFWKRLRADTRWATRLNSEADATVRKVTALCVAAAMDASVEVSIAARNSRSALSSLPGFNSGDALASAVIVAAEPSRFAVYDKRAHAALIKLDIRLSNAPGRYSRYMTVVDKLAAEMSTDEQAWSARDIDKALFWLGRP